MTILYPKPRCASGVITVLAFIVEPIKDVTSRPVPISFNKLSWGSSLELSSIFQFVGDGFELTPLAAFAVGFMSNLRNSPNPMSTHSKYRYLQSHASLLQTLGVIYLEAPHPNGYGSSTNLHALGNTCLPNESFSQLDPRAIAAPFIALKND